MNREIRFRGKTLYDRYDHYASPEPDTKEGTWVYGDLMTEYPYHKGLTIVENGRYHEVDPETVGQYTGMKIGGQKLFEHDVIRYRETSLDDWRYGVVVWCGDWDYPAFDVEPSIDCGYNSLSYIVAVYQAEIIGNVHDNPEFLEVLSDE